MENIINSKFMTELFNKEEMRDSVKNLAEAKTNKEYIIKDIKTEDKELKNYLFTLGCYEGESITLISILSENYIISVKDARYSIDKDLAKAIIV